MQIVRLISVLFFTVECFAAFSLPDPVLKENEVVEKVENPCKAQVKKFGSRTSEQLRTEPPSDECTGKELAQARPMAVRRIPSEDRIIFARGKVIYSKSGDKKDVTKNAWWAGDKTKLKKVLALALDLKNREIVVLEKGVVRFFPLDMNGNIHEFRSFADEALKDGLSIAVNPDQDQVMVLTKEPSILFYSRLEADQNRGVLKLPPPKIIRKIPSTELDKASIDLVMKTGSDQLYVLDIHHGLHVFSTRIDAPVKAIEDAIFVGNNLHLKWATNIQYFPEQEKFEVETNSQTYYSPSIELLLATGKKVQDKSLIQIKEIPTDMRHGYSIEGMFSQWTHPGMKRVKPKARPVRIENAENLGVPKDLDPKEAAPPVPQ